MERKANRYWQVGSANLACLQVQRTGCDGDAGPEPVGKAKQIYNLVNVAYEQPEEREKDGEDDGDDGGALLKVQH